MHVSPAYYNSKDVTNILVSYFALNLLFMSHPHPRKAGVKWCVCTFPPGNTSSWTCYRQSVQHSVSDGTQSSCSSCLFWKLGGGQRCYGVPRSVAALTICRMNKGGNGRTSELLLGSRRIRAHCTCEAEEIVNTSRGFAATRKGLKIAGSSLCMQKDLQ